MSIEGVRFYRFEGKPTNAELKVHLDFERARLAQFANQTNVMVLELRDVWTSHQRAMMRDFEIESLETMRLDPLGMAMVVPSTLIRGAFTAYFWLAGPQYPTKAVSSPAAAYDFVVAGLEQANLPVPSRERYEQVANSDWTARIVRGGKYELLTEQERREVS